jgi:hypothetical protein
VIVSAKVDRPTELLPPDKVSPLAAARLHRRLTVGEAAASRRADLGRGRVARGWARLPLPICGCRPQRDAALRDGAPDRPPRGAQPGGSSGHAETVREGRARAAAARARRGGGRARSARRRADRRARKRASEAGRRGQQCAPPAPWKIRVDVLNGSGDIDYTRQVASRIQAFAYQIGRVTRARRFGQARTVVYFEPGGDSIAARLAKQLGVPTAPLPGGSHPLRLVVIVGPPNVGA